MFCNNCGTKLDEGVLFCPNCGNKVDNVPVEENEDDKTVILSEEMYEVVRENENENPSETVQEVNSDTQSDANTQEGQDETIKGEGPQEQDIQQQNIQEQKGETIEAVEISPTGVVETNAAIAVPNEVQKKFCPNCGTANNMNDLFCQECGMFFGNAEEKMGQGMSPKSQKSGKVVKVVVSAAIAVILIALICMVPRFIKGSGNGKDQDFVVYIKDNELFMAADNKYEPIQIGDKFYEDKDDAQTYSYYSRVSYSPDYKYIYYPKNFETDEYTYDLYYKKVGDKKAEEVKVDSDVLSYKIINDNKIVYIKDYDDRKLYLYDGNDSVKITSDAAWMTVSEDGKFILWRSSEGDNKLYVQDTAMKADKVKLDSDVEYLCDFSDDLKTIVYVKDDNLYVMKNMDEKEKIASDIEDAWVYDINGNLQIYYVKESNEINLYAYDFIEDDYLSQDQSITEPRIEDYQTVTYVNDYFGSREKVETDDAYYRELEKYEEKETRDYLREELKNYQPVGTGSGNIYYYSAKEDESVKVIEALVLGGNSIGTDTALMYLWNIDIENIEKVKLSKLLEETEENIEKKFNEALLNSMQLLYLKDGEIFEVDDSDIDYKWLDDVNVVANEKVNTLYISYEFYNPDTEKYHEELYSYDYRSANAKLQLLCDEFDEVAALNNSEGIYYTNEDEDLYCNGTKIDSDVYIWSVTVQENGTVLYLTDIDKNDREGTLKIYQNGKTTKIADDVVINTYGVFDRDKIAFLADYNFDKRRGDLEIYNGKETIRVDTDVTSIIY